MNGKVSAKLITKQKNFEKYFLLIFVNNPKQKEKKKKKMGIPKRIKDANSKFWLFHCSVKLTINNSICY